jgi:hypothetical protein
MICILTSAQELHFFRKLAARYSLMSQASARQHRQSVH